jgi:hypothetical protein
MTLTARIALALKGTNASLEIPLITLAETPAADAAIENLQTVGTSAEALVVGDIGTPGWLCGVNTDATNYVDLSLASDGSAPFAKVKAGQPFCLPVATKVIYAKANTAPVNLLYLMTSA